MQKSSSKKSFPAPISHYNGNNNNHNNNNNNNNNNKGTISHSTFLK